MAERTQKCVFIVCGAPAAGKSHYAARLAARERCALIELDAVSEPIVRAALRALQRNVDDRDSAFYKATFRQPIYDALWRLAADNVRASGAVVLAGPFSREIARANWTDRTAADSAHAAIVAASGSGGDSLPAFDVRVLYVRCSDATRRRRMRARGEPRDTAKLADWTEHARRYQLPECEHVLVDNEADDADEFDFDAKHAAGSHEKQHSEC